MDIYVQKDGQRVGPFTETRIRQGIDAGEFDPADLASYKIMGDWLPLGEILEQKIHPAADDHAAVSTSSSSVEGFHPKLLVYALASAGLSGWALICAFGDHKVLWFLGTLSGIIIGHYVCWLTRTQLHRRLIRRFAVTGLLIGYGTTSIYMAFLTLVFVVGQKPRASTTPVAEAPAQRVEQIIQTQMQRELEANKQNIFDHIHPVGTAKSVVLHDVTVTTWKRGKDTNRFEDIEQLSIRYTLYWSTPFTADGFTKIVQIYDAESQRYTNTQILATNGMTNQDAQGALGKIVGTLLQYQAQKAGAEEAAHQYYNNQ